MKSRRQALFVSILRSIIIDITQRKMPNVLPEGMNHAGLAFIFSGALVCLTYGKNYVCCSASPVEQAETVEAKPTEEITDEGNASQPLDVKETE